MKICWIAPNPDYELFTEMADRLSKFHDTQVVGIGDEKADVIVACILPLTHPYTEWVDQQIKQGRTVVL